MTLLWQNLWIFRQSVIRLTKNHCRFSYLGAIFHCLLAASVALFRGRQTLIGSANCTPNNKLSPSPLPSSLDQLRWRWRRCHSFLEKVPIWDKYQGPVSQNWPPLIPLPAQGLEKRVVGLVWWITRFDPIVGNRKFLTICPLWLLAQEMALHVIWCPIFAPYDIPNIDYICKYGPKTSWRQVHQT